MCLGVLGLGGVSDQGAVAEKPARAENAEVVRRAVRSGAGPELQEEPQEEELYEGERGSDEPGEVAKHLRRVCDALRAARKRQRPTAV